MKKTLSLRIALLLFSAVVTIAAMTIAMQETAKLPVTGIKLQKIRGKTEQHMLSVISGVALSTVYHRRDQV